MLNRKLQKKASFTIELTLLMPIILVIFIIIIYGSYYMHDRVAIERTCYVSSLRGLQHPKESEAEMTAKEEFIKEMNDRLLGKWIYDIDISISGDVICAEFDGEMAAGQGLLKTITGGKLYRYSTQYELKMINETQYLREHTKGL